MSVIGIVCEFNPFHKGHKYLIDSAKKDNDTVVCVMSGNFVQRGEPALFSKEERVRAALLNGADIVLELPFVYATTSAEIFAYNAVKILNDFGCEKLAFGTEDTDISQLEKAVEVLNSKDFDVKIKKHLDEGVSYPSARQRAFDEYKVECDISTPNNILAIEYIKAIKKLDSNMIPMPVHRIGAGYNDNETINGISSATHIRQLIKSGEDFAELVPENVIEIYKTSLNNGKYVSDEKFNLAALSILRSRLNADILNIANMAEGLENRIKSAISDSTSITEVYDKAKTKRFTHSRIRRAVLSLIMNIAAEDLKITVPYCRLLGFNVSASAVMGELASKSKLPFVASFSDISKLDDNAKHIFDLECKTGDFYSLIMQKSTECAKEKVYSPVKLK